MSLVPALLWQNLPLILFLALLEGILSVDNAVILATLASRVPRERQKRALTYGLVGALVFRFAALFFASTIVRLGWVKGIGAAYLVLVAIRHFLRSEPASRATPSGQSFWKTVLSIELADLAFAIDSILAAVALSNKLWVIFTGSFIGVILVRLAASFFMTLMKKFPRLEPASYVLILLIGLKLGIETIGIGGVDFHETSNAAFWIFWGTMAGVIALGLRPRPA